MRTRRLDGRAGFGKAASRGLGALGSARVRAVPHALRMALALAVQGLPAMGAPAEVSKVPTASGSDRLVQAQAAPVTCTIKAGPEAGQWRIEARARATVATSVRFGLAILKEYAAGTARTMQSGTVSLAAGEERVLAAVTLEAAAEGHVRVELAVDTENGRISCAYP